MDTGLLNVKHRGVNPQPCAACLNGKLLRLRYVFWRTRHFPSFSAVYFHFFPLTECLSLSSLWPELQRCFQSFTLDHHIHFASVTFVRAFVFHSLSLLSSPISASVARHFFYLSVTLSQEYHRHMAARLIPHWLGGSFSLSLLLMKPAYRCLIKWLHRWIRFVLSVFYC